MQTTASAADPVAPSWFARRRTLLTVILCLLLPLALLGGFFAAEASRYSLLVPMHAPKEQNTQLSFWHEGDPGHEIVVGPIILDPSSSGRVVRFPLGTGTIATFQFEPTLGEGEISVGAPVVRCDAYRWLGFDVPFYRFALKDLEMLHQVASADQEGDHLRVVTTPEADCSIFAIHLEQPLRLGFNAEAFVLTFVPVAFGWTFLVLLTTVLIRKHHDWLRARATRWWPALVAALLSFRPAERGPVSRWEKRAIVAVFVLSAVVQTNAVLHGGMKGQDYPYLYNFSVEIAEHPEKPWHFVAQDPPVFVLSNAFWIWLTDGVNAQEVCGFYNLSVNLVGLWVFYLLARRFIEDAVWRVALVTLVGFLPFRLIHTVVLAGDALILCPFFTLAWVLAAMTDEAGGTRRRWLAGACAGLLTVGVLTKYTFMSALVAVSLTMFQLARRRLVTWRESALLLTLALLLPVGVVIDQQRRHPNFSGAMTFEYDSDPAMSVRDIAGLHGRDMHIFRAPPYDEPWEVARRGSNGKPFDPGPPYELLMDHHYSYLALNHLTVFTDPMNIFQYDPTDAYFGARSDRNQHLMAAAVKTAVPITLLCVGAAGLLSALVLGFGLIVPRRSRADLEAVWLLAFGWFSNIVVFLPLLPAAYIAGFWTPRLTMPALLTFMLLTVYVLERLLPGKAGRAAAWVLLVYVVAQSTLQVSFLWPWGKM